MNFNIIKKLLSIMLLMTMFVSLNCSACDNSKISQKKASSHFLNLESDDSIKEAQSDSSSLTLGKVTTICSVTFGIVGFIVGCFLPSCCPSCFPCELK